MSWNADAGSMTPIRNTRRYIGAYHRPPDGHFQTSHIPWSQGYYWTAQSEHGLEWQDKLAPGEKSVRKGIKQKWPKYFWIGPVGMIHDKGLVETGHLVNALHHTCTMVEKTIVFVFLKRTIFNPFLSWGQFRYHHHEYDQYNVITTCQALLPEARLWTNWSGFASTRRPPQPWRSSNTSK